MNGLQQLANIFQHGESTVRALVKAGQLDVALAHAVWLRGAGHPKGKVLVRRVQRAMQRQRQAQKLPH